MGLFVSTVSADVLIKELGLVLTHPVTDYDLSAQFRGDDIARASSLTAAITGGQLIWRKVAAGPIQPAADYDPQYWLVAEGNEGPGFFDDRGVTFKDLTGAISVSASPGFTWGRSGNVSKGSFLANETVPSNLAGRVVFLASANVKKVFIAQQDPVVVKYELYYHDGNAVGMTLVGSVTTGAVRVQSFDVSWLVPSGKQLAFAVASDSANGSKNPVVGVIMTGTLV